jgi:hypothetical protein
MSMNDRRAPWLMQTMVIGRFLVLSARHLGAQAPLPAAPDTGDTAADGHHAADAPGAGEPCASEACAPDGFEDTRPGWYGTT